MSAKEMIGDGGGRKYANSQFSDQNRQDAISRESAVAAHHSIWRHLYGSMHAAPKPKSKLNFVTFDKESNMSTLWRREEFLRICSKEDLAEKAQDIEVTIPVKKSQQARFNLNPKSFFVNRFWGRRPDGFAIHEALHIGYILEFKRSTGTRGSWS